MPFLRVFISADSMPQVWRSLICQMLYYDVPKADLPARGVVPSCGIRLASSIFVQARLEVSSFASDNPPSLFTLFEILFTLDSPVDVEFDENFSISGESIADLYDFISDVV